MIASVTRAVAAAAIALVVVTSGSVGAAWAYWSTAAALTPSVQAGTVAVTLTGADALAAQFTTSDRVRSAAVVITNTGTLAVSYTLTGAATGSATLASGVALQRWSAGSASACSGTASGSTASWSAFPGATGTLNPGTSQIWCVRTSLTAQQVGSLAGTSLSATLSVTGLASTWSATASQSAAQSVVAASMACSASTPPWGLTVSWNPPAGWPYHPEQVWVNGSLFSQQNSNYTARYIDWSALQSFIGAVPGNPQTFTVEARAQNPSTGQWTTIAQRTIVTRIIDYGNYEHRVAECN